MAIAKVILNGDTLMDVTSNTNTSSNMFSGVVGTKNDGTKVTGSYVPPSFVISGLTVTPTETTQTFNSTAVSGYKPVTVNAISSNYVGSAIPLISSLSTISVSTSVTSTTAYFRPQTYTVGAGYLPSAITPQVNAVGVDVIGVSTITPSSGSYTIYSPKYLSKSLTIEAIPSAYIIPSGTSNITSNGTYDITQYASVSVSCGSEEYYDVYKAIVLNDGRFSSTHPSGMSEWIAQTSKIKAGLFYGAAIDGDFTFDNVTEIGSLAFANTKYTSPGFSVNFPKLTSMEISCFYGGSVGKFYAPLLTVISHSAFYQCRVLTTVSAPNCSSIGWSAFNLCNSLEEIYFPNCTNIGNYAFQSCIKLSNAFFPSCTSIGNAAFQYCSSLASISFPNCTSIGNYAFWGCRSLVSASFPSCTSIGGSAFQSCSGLRTINLPQCSSIGNGAFSSCSSLESIDLPLCSFIGKSAFGLCYSLNTVRLGACTSIDNSAFFKCYNLLSLYLLGSSIPILSDTFGSTPIAGYTTSTGGVYGSIYVPASLYSSFLTANNWSSFSSRIVSV